MIRSSISIPAALLGLLTLAGRPVWAGPAQVGDGAGGGVQAAVKQSADSPQESPEGSLGASIARLLDVESSSVGLRRGLAEELAVSLRGPAVLQVAAALADPDLAVRRSVIQLLKRPDLGGTLRPERIALLLGAARADPSARCRRDAIAAIGEIGGPRAASVLAGLIETSGDPPSRMAAAKALATSPGARDVLAVLVQKALGSAASLAFDTGAVAELLPPYGQWLADRPEIAAADSVPLVIGLRHPSGALRRASVESFERAIQRLISSQSPGRAKQLLGRLGELGVERDIVLYQRARIALGAEGDAAGALAASRELIESRGLRFRPVARVDAFESQLWLFRGLYLAGTSYVALGDFQSAESYLDRAALALDGALAERRDLLAPSEQIRHVDLLLQRALAEVMRTLLAAAANLPIEEQLRRARSTHAIHLEAQAILAELRGDLLTGWDSLLLADLSPYRLLFGRSGFAASGSGALHRRRLVDLQGRLGVLLASVAPGELPGFRVIAPPLPAVERARLLDPLRDEERLVRLERIRAARINGIDDELEEAQEALERARESSFGLVPEEEIDRIERLRRRRFFAARDRENEEEGDRSWIRDLRIPGSAALWHAQDLLDQGRGKEAMEIAAEVEADIDRRGISTWWYTLGHDRVIRARLMRGSALTDEGDGAGAESMLLGATERLESLERELSDNGASARDLAPLRDLLATALVSLAVNANVRLQNPAKAAAYYERAYGLRQDEFMRTLLACYRARDGREAEARSLLASIRPGPGTWYNLSCTHALLGDTDRALDLLGQELSLNHSTEASRNRQRAWASEDPDLASLRDSSRFQRLVRQR